MSKIHYGVTLGVQAKQISAQFESLYEFKRGNLGILGVEILKEKVGQHNEGSLYKLVVERRDGNKFVVKPFCLMEEFFLKAILDNIAKYTHDDRSLIINVNMKHDQTFFNKCTALFTKTFPRK
jgi:hypothetical protein